MKSSHVLICFLLLFVSCQRAGDLKHSINGEIVSSQALSPLPCHSTSFVTDYKTLPGQVPPFMFNKTLYSDTRVKSVHVLSRANPIYKGYKPQAYEIIGKFSYSTNAAILTGTMQLWEYFKTSTGAAGKKSISKKTISWTFFFNENGYCKAIRDNFNPEPYEAQLNINYDYETNTKIQWIQNADNGDMEVITDEFGNPLTYVPSWYSICWAPRVNYKYNYDKPTTGKRYSYIPTQNWFGQRYSIAELMQWIPQSTHERISVAAEFYPHPVSCPDCCGGGVYNPGPKVLQTRYYKNHKFDFKGNLISYTYEDNVLQKTTWFCK